MNKKYIKKSSICLLFAIIALILAFFEIPYKEIIRYVLFGISYLIIGFDVIFKALKNITRGQIFDENFLMCVATIGAIAIKEFPEAIAVMFLYQLGEEFQRLAVGNSRDSIKELVKIKPEYANIYKNQNIVQVEPNEVEIGEIIVVKPGEKVPLDGIIVRGKSMIDTKTITGESVPIMVSEKDIIYSGCINLNSVIEIEVTKKFEDSTVSKILELVEEATSKKAHTERFITKFSKFYTPIVCLLAICLATIPWLVFGKNNIEWLYRALTFLVISCPCALVISVPLGFFAGIGKASKKGILIKGSNYIELLSDSKYIVFDKTGTITKGVFEIQKIEEKNISKQEFIRIAAHCERFSNHPIAVSIKNMYKGKYDESKIEGLEEIPGRGLHARIFFSDTLIGNADLMRENNIKISPIDEIGTVIHLAVSGEYKGYILISDEIKPEAKTVMKSLKKLGIKKTYMATGDEEEIAKYVAKETEIDEYKSKMLPDQKLVMLENIIDNEKKSGKVIFVGDGVNDSPCLARADVSIAMGMIGSDAAIEAADVVIMTDELTKILDAITISKKTIKTVKQNIIFALFIKIVVLVLSAMGFSNMWLAVFADVGVTVIAILNSMKILNIEKEKNTNKKKDKKKLNPKHDNKNLKNNKNLE